MPANYEISATDARRLMAGDAVDLWMEKRGRKEPVDLSNELRVQMGIHTESLNRQWFMKQTGLFVSIAPGVVLPGTTTLADYDHPTCGSQVPLFTRSNARPWQMCHPDGIVFSNKDKSNPLLGEPLGVFEAKHTGATGDFLRPEDVVKTNYWQFVHQMMVTGLDKVFVSVFYGNDEWRVFEVLRDDGDMAQLLGTEMAFLKELEDDTPPGVVPTIQAEKIPGVPTRRLKTSDVDAANWGADYVALAADFRGLHGADEQLADVKDKLKAFLPDDAICIEAHGIRINRTKKAITIGLIKEPKEKAA